ncbi:MAG: Alkyl hydroperoxide reductase AhpD [Anaerolineales bacterium]|nr:Alkyl hydroperoxide reductase AhpD [Anaerolineales bacterium]
MPRVKLVSEAEADPKAKAVFEKIKEAYGTKGVPALYRAMANHPDYLESTWDRMQAVMAPSEKLDSRTKEIIALAVSAVAGCQYCTTAHTRALKGMGFQDRDIVELLGVVSLWSDITRFATSAGVG